MENFAKIEFKCIGGLIIDCILVKNFPGSSVAPDWDLQPELFLIADDTDRNSKSDILFGEPVTTCTRKLPHLPTAGSFYIKDYSENEGLLDTLVKAGIIEPTGYSQRSGFVVFPECRILHPEKIPVYEENELRSVSLGEQKLEVTI